MPTVVVVVVVDAVLVVVVVLDVVVLEPPPPIVVVVGVGPMVVVVVVPPPIVVVVGGVTPTPMTRSFDGPLTPHGLRARSRGEVDAVRRLHRQRGGQTTRIEHHDVQQSRAATSLDDIGRRRAAPIAPLQGDGAPGDAVGEVDRRPGRPAAREADANDHLVRRRTERSAGAADAHVVARRLARHSRSGTAVPPATEDVAALERPGPGARLH